MKVTTIAPANIAFIKYWGRTDHKHFIPKNNNISMTMSGSKTTSTIELTDDEHDFIEVKFFGNDYVVLENNSIKRKNLYDQIERIRNLAGSNKRVKIKSENNFPADAGIAASASSFASLTGALLLAYGLNDYFDDKEEFSRQIRLCGSSSACRSAMGGYVELVAGNDHQSTFCTQIADENHWDLVNIVAVVNPEQKKIETSAGHDLADTSPYMKERIIEMQERIKGVRKAIVEKDFHSLGELIEEEAISMHMIMMTQKPSLLYWSAGTINIMRMLREWRGEGLHAYFTIDAGPNVHVICQKSDAKEVQKRLDANLFVKWTIYNEACPGVSESQEHLF